MTTTNHNRYAPPVAVYDYLNDRYVLLEAGTVTTTNGIPHAPLNSATTASITRDCVGVYTPGSTVTAGTTQNSGDLAVGIFAEVAIDITTTAQTGTAPTIQYFWERKGTDNVYYVLWSSSVLTAAANTVTTSIGSGMAYNHSLGSIGRLRWVIGGTSTPTWTHSINCFCK